MSHSEFKVGLNYTERCCLKKEKEREKGKKEGRERKNIMNILMPLNTSLKSGYNGNFLRQDLTMLFSLVLTS